jgi:hypothetical protein
MVVYKVSVCIITIYNTHTKTGIYNSKNVSFNSTYVSHNNTHNKSEDFSVE